MSLPPPRLDTRSYAELVANATALIDRICPEWADRNPADPGITLVELFAFLTENLLYRVNRVPDKLSVNLLNLVGVRQRSPAAAVARLTITRPSGDGEAMLPVGTRVTSKDGAIAFITTQPGHFEPSVLSTDVEALHCETIVAEFLGTGDGTYGQWLRVAKPPIVAPTGDGLDLIVGVASATDAVLPGLSGSRSFESATYGIWREVESFADAAPGDPVYIVDRYEGRVQFAPAPASASVTDRRSLPAVPQRGDTIRAWYRRGGGRSGNVAPDTLVTLKDTPTGWTVTNAARSTGGADAETVAQVVERGPLDVVTMRGAVSARDYERLALQVGGVARARAYAKIDLWRHATPGTVEVLIVPSVEPEAIVDGAVTAALIVERRIDDLRERVRRAFAGKLVLGTRLSVDWARVRPVSVSARIKIHRDDNFAEVETRLLGRINQLFSPVHGNLSFGRELTASDVYEALLAEPGVNFLREVRLTIGEAPNRGVREVVADPHQPRTWFAAGEIGVHRSLDDGDSWSRVFPPSTQPPTPPTPIIFARRHPDRAGLLAIGARDGDGGLIHLSEDCGETWRLLCSFDHGVNDAAWSQDAGQPSLLIATDRGLFRLHIAGDQVPAQVRVDPDLDPKGYYTVICHAAEAGSRWIAVAAKELGGVRITPEGLSGSTNRFPITGLKGKDIRNLMVHSIDGHDYLWAGTEAEAAENGEGAFRVGLDAGLLDGSTAFRAFSTGWQGGSCEGLAWAGEYVFAGSNRSGVLRLDTSAAEPAWGTSPANNGLPRREDRRPLDVVTSVAAADRDGKRLVFASGPAGVFRSDDASRTFFESSRTEFKERVPLPINWLYCAGTHDLTVIADDEEGGAS